jgi:DNA-binding NarL/FixJ family response regulator
VADEITCLIADDHEVVREGLRLALSRSPRIRVIGEAVDGASAVALAERRRPDVVIMDLRMPDMDGLEAIPEIRKGDPDVAIIVLSGFSADRMGGPALERGADGYVEKGTPIQELRDATRMAVASRRGD